MKKFISLFLTLVIALGMVSFASADSGVTRAELAVMLVESSQYKDEAKGNAPFNVFTDVNKSGPSASSIYIASRQGWMLGFTDGSFRPNNKLKLEEVCCAVLKYKSFNAKELRGSFPRAYVEKADSLGYLKGVSAKLGDYITAAECKTIFHNAAVGEYKSDGSYVGVVISYSKGVNSDNASVEGTITMMDSEGTTRTFAVASGIEYKAGELISANVADSKAKVTRLKEMPLSGKINSKLTSFGNEALADDLTVIEADSYGNAKVLDVDILAGESLGESDVRYYTKNSKGEIDSLILSDCSGNLWTYGLLTNAVVNDISMNLSGSYTYLVNGKSNIKQVQGKAFSLENGGIAVKTSPLGVLETMRQLKDVKLSSINENTAVSGVNKYDVASDVQVYVKSGDNYYQSDISAVNSSSYKNMSGYYDTIGFGQIRIVVCW